MKIVTYTCAGTDVPLKYIPNLRAKRLSLRFSLKDATLILTHPPRTAEPQIKAFLNHCGPWVERQLQKVAETPSINPGEKITLYGDVFECILDPLRKKPVLCKVTQTLRLPQRYTQKDLYDFFKKIAVEKLTPLLETSVKALGQKVEKVMIRDTRSRWGSCSGRKSISLSWRLILVPPEVARYVCIHETAHLIHMNHSKAFWQVVEEFCPAYRSHRKWLKINGPALMRL